MAKSNVPRPVFIAMVVIFILYFAATVVLQYGEWGLSAVSNEYYYGQIVFIFCMLVFFVLALWAVWEDWLWIGFIAFVIVMVFFWYTWNDRKECETRIADFYAKKLHIS